MLPPGPRVRDVKQNGAWQGMSHARGNLVHGAVFRPLKGGGLLIRGLH